jgi:integrase
LRLRQSLAATLSSNGKPSAHPLRGDEVRALRELRRQSPDSSFVFATERGGPFTPDSINKLVKRIGERAGFAFPVHAHMLRHACGYALANAGHDTRRIQDWLGHRSIPAHDALHAAERGAVQGLLAVRNFRACEYSTTGTDDDSCAKVSGGF